MPSEASVGSGDQSIEELRRELAEAGEQLLICRPKPKSMLRVVREPRRFGHQNQFWPSR